MYLELHDVSTGRRSHQTRAHILGMFVQYAHISWVLIVVHHLQAGSKREKTHSFVGKFWGFIHRAEMDSPKPPGKSLFVHHSSVADGLEKGSVATTRD